MIKKILVPLDGSELGEQALPYAIELGAALNAEIDVLYVCEPHEMDRKSICEHYVEDMAGHVRETLKEFKAGSEVRGIVIDGKPASEIVDYTEKYGVNLVVIVSHGSSGIQPWPMGGTASKIVNQANTPVLLVRAKEKKPQNKTGYFRKILVPLDGSETGEAALPFVREITENLVSEVVLYQAIVTGENVHSLGRLDHFETPETLVSQMKTDAEQYLKNTVGKAAGSRATASFRVSTGEAAKEVIKLESEIDASLVAMSTHGHSGFERWSFGSVTYKVLQRGSRPVLLVKARSV